MHDSQVGSDAWTLELLEHIGSLADPGGRAEAAAALAVFLGGEQLLLFAPDPELGVVLPAPGLSQVLRGPDGWRELLARCAERGECSGAVLGTDGRTVAARTSALPDGTAAVLLEPGHDAAGPESLRPVLPLLGALFRAERELRAHEARARSAADEAERAQVLTRALQEMRGRLQEALLEAQQARAAARERAEEAERERAAAEAASRAKSDFLASMSHELRTPINAVVGYTELLELGIAGPVTPEQQAQLERIRASSAHLLGLVNDVLDLSKVEAGRMSVHQEQVALAPAAAEALAVLAMQAADAEISVENECRDPEIRFFGDHDRVRQILVNLLSNAIKFTDPGGRVSIRCETNVRPEESAELAGEGPWTCIEVEDDGIGIAEDELTRVFLPFVQADSGHTRRRGGTGLGLAISRELARLMGGDVTARSRKGRGSCFRLWLPAASAPVPADPKR